MRIIMENPQMKIAKKSKTSKSTPFTDPVVRGGLKWGWTKNKTHSPNKIHYSDEKKMWILCRAPHTACDWLLTPTEEKLKQIMNLQPFPKGFSSRLTSYPHIIYEKFILGTPASRVDCLVFLVCRHLVEKRRKKMSRHVNVVVRTVPLEVPQWGWSQNVRRE